MDKKPVERGALLHAPTTGFLHFEGAIRMIILCASIIMSVFAGTQCFASLQNNGETRYTIVILPLQNNTNAPTAADSVDNLLRSELIKTGYFNVVERDKTYETIMEFVPGDELYIGGYKFNDTFTIRKGQDTTDGKKITHKGDVGWLDMPIEIKRHLVIKFAEKLDTDFAITGSLNQFGEKIRMDIELIGVRYNRALASLTANAESIEGLPDIVNSLTLDVTKVCRSANAQRDSNNIVSRYKQGLYTYETAIQKLETLSSTIPDSLAPPVTLLSMYLERDGMDKEIITIAERVLTLFDPQQNEHLEILQTMGIDPFDTAAKTYEKNGSIDKVIETHTKAIKIYPINTLAHYKALALAYKKRGMERQYMETLKDALRISTTDPDIYYYLGAEMEKKGNLGDALEYYRKCLKYATDIHLTSEVRKRISQIESAE